MTVPKIVIPMNGLKPVNFSIVLQVCCFCVSCHDKFPANSFPFWEQCETSKLWPHLSSSYDFLLLFPSSSIDRSSRSLNFTFPPSPPFYQIPSLLRAPTNLPTYRSIALIWASSPYCNSSIQLVTVKALQRFENGYWIFRFSSKNSSVPFCLSMRVANALLCRLKSASFFRFSSTLSTPIRYLFSPSQFSLPSPATTTSGAWPTYCVLTEY